MEHKGTKIIETERLILRPFQIEDAEFMFRNWASDPEVTRFLTWATHEDVNVSEQVIQDWINKKDDLENYQWALEWKETGEPIGSMGAVRIDNRTESVTIGYCIGRSWWGKGFTAEALRAVIRFFFDEVGMNCVNACHDPRNPNSGKVMKKGGMTYEGTWRAGGVNNLGVCDESWYSILKEEYYGGRTPEIIIRNEGADDYHAVEELTRKAFWNVYVPGCNEHYLVHVMREHEDFIPELDLVAVTAEGKIVGNVMYTRATLCNEKGEEASVLTFGPISVLPEYQRQGIGKMLLEYSFGQAREMGYPAIVIFGNPADYTARGFKSCKKYNVYAMDGSFPSAMMVKELEEGLLDGRKWFYRESPVYDVKSSDAEAFEKGFEPMDKGFRPSQEEFYIHSHSVMKG